MRIYTILLAGSALMAPAFMSWAADLPPPPIRPIVVQPKAVPAIAKPPAHEAVLVKDGVTVRMICAARCKVVRKADGKTIVLDGEGGAAGFKYRMAEARKNGWK